MTQSTAVPCLLSTCFGSLVDPRADNTQYPLLSILGLVLMATLAGADGPTQIVRFAHAKRDLVDQYLWFPKGIPSRFTVARVMGLIDPKAFEAGFVRWVKEALGQVREQVAIDGKTARGSRNRPTNQDPIHLVSAFATERGIALGQWKTEADSNEIPAIPLLLKQLCIAGCLVTIDAMGCQKAIARTVVEQEADYVLTVKENQEGLYADLEQEFREVQARDLPERLHSTYDSGYEKGHGRIERRRCWYLTHPETIAWLNPKGQWAELAGVALVENERHEVVSGKTSVERRYLITSLGERADAEQIAQAVRGHWGIENRLHWVLDVAFQEDKSRLRQNHAGQNWALVRKIATNLLRQDTRLNAGIKGKRLTAAWNDQYLQHLLEPLHML